MTWSVEQLDAAKEHDQLIVVVGEGEDSQRAEVSFYQKNEDGSWTEVHRGRLRGKEQGAAVRTGGR